MLIYCYTVAIYLCYALYYTVKDTEHIEDYSFSQTTLEQVFIQFSKDHEEEETETKGA